MTRHTDLDQFWAADRDDSDAKMECYFDRDTTNLWHVYVGEMEIFNLLSDTVIEALEREYAKHLRSEREQSKTDAAIDRYEASLV
jgi:hypothetical protein